MRNYAMPGKTVHNSEENKKTGGSDIRRDEISHNIRLKRPEYQGHAALYPSGQYASTPAEDHREYGDVVALLQSIVQLPGHILAVDRDKASVIEHVVLDEFPCEFLDCRASRILRLVIHLGIGDVDIDRISHIDLLSDK